MRTEEQLSFEARLATLTELAADRLEDILPALDVRTRKVGRLLAGACPVHGGDNQTAFNLYPEGHTARGNWSCHTHKCEGVFKRTILGLVRGVLSHQQCGWTGNGGRMLPFMDAVKWTCKFVGQEWGKLKADTVLAEKKRFASRMAALTVMPGREVTGWKPEAIQSRLIVPSPYFLARGFDKDVLGRFGVGDAKTQDASSPMFHRAVVPVLDRDGKLVVGTSGRTLFSQCEGCHRWHADDARCPTGDDRQLPSFAKWRHTPGFQKERHLFGFHQAREAIKRSSSVVLVEGPGDVMKLHQAGVENAVALFGVVLNDPQSVLLELSGAHNVVILMDPDEAGREAAHEIRRMLCRTFRVAVPAWETETDIGEMSVEDIRKQLVPLVG